MKRIDGRVAVITGAGSGIGRATADALGARGCEIALVDVNAARLAEASEALGAKGVKTSCHVVDVADPEQMAALPEAVRVAHGGVHILVNNAGVSVAATFDDHTLEDLQWIVGINLWGVIHGCKFFLPLLREADEAHIVNLSSMLGFLGVPGQSAYCATKFAVKGFTESLWAELHDTPIGVTSIHPGGISTNIANAMRSYDDEIRDATAQGVEQSRPPTAVADAIVKAIEGNRLRSIVGIEAYVSEWLKRLMPVSTHKLLARQMKKFMASSADEA